MIAAQEVPRGPRPGATRRAALQAVVSMGHGSDVPERFRAVIYTTGISSMLAPEMDELRGYVDGRYWTLSGTYFDVNDAVPASERPALLDAVSSIRNGQATALVIDQQSYDALSPTAQVWLNAEIERYGGFITPVSRRND
jgi:hypothetical protein